MPLQIRTTSSHRRQWLGLSFPNYFHRDRQNFLCKAVQIKHAATTYFPCPDNQGADDLTLVPRPPSQA